MASYYLEIFLSAVWFLAIWAWRTKIHKRVSYKNLPVIGMLPTLLLSVENIHDICTEVLRKSPRGTFLFRGPWFSNMEILCTVDPADVHYIMSSNFQNFPKGPRFREIFDVFGRGIFNSDSDSWRFQRKAARALLGHRGFFERLARVNREKIEAGLIPVFETMIREKNRVFDLQDVFQRLTFDTTCALVTGYDPGCLSAEMPDVPYAKAMDDAEEAVFMRHVLPETVWKFKRWAQIGSERKLRDAQRVLDEVIGGYVVRKRDDLMKKGNLSSEESSDDDDLLSLYISRGLCEGEDEDEFFRDTVLNLMIAGRDTMSSALTWLVWLISTHPEVERKILEELELVICGSGEGNDGGKKLRVFMVEETSKLVYMHGAICEALRLYPPVPFQSKMPTESDIVPSGHYVNPKMKVMFFLYAMGRMESIWGKDCLEFKPERWITERGTIKHEPSYKFLAFNAGPRTCLGKEVAFSQIKSVVATIIFNYRVSVVEGHRVAPNCSVILYMKDGLKVRVAKRLG
ncbi:cytochrome P450- family 96- subfamily A-polypeptide 1 [Striga hermonthica]|uniref:Cytochrome P450- family 96- subfamily A-polypeptide 1 n=1 Tax=Striga hermonthica TaxID=68872 RepID=A0A9N7NXI1_STRHE|nr:cytochrome P450- family 96- subfamily A-polypeptide 1 [Striga hermonthica]